MIGALYLEHLTPADLRLLAAAAEGGSLDDRRSRLVREPDHILSLLSATPVFNTLFRGDGRDAFLHASPFLTFATLVHRVARDLGDAGFIQEWVSPNQRIPVFDVASLREFAADPLRRLFLSELLASYTRVSSGSIVYRSPRGWRRRRFSELDPLQLLELVHVVPAGERPAVYRRLGDLTLFLTGIFPDHAGGRLVPGAEASESPVALLERMGRRAYLAAWRASGGHRRGTARVLAEVAEDGFGRARRVLNFLTDRYLFPLRDSWFPRPA